MRFIFLGNVRLPHYRPMSYGYCRSMISGAVILQVLVSRVDLAAKSPGIVEVVSVRLTKFRLVYKNMVLAPYA